MKPLFTHIQATKGQEPYLLAIDAETGANKFSCLVRPPVTVPDLKGIDTRQLMREGLEPRMVIPWLAQMAKTVKTIITYDADQLLRVMEAELSRLGKSHWARPGIEFIGLSDKATSLCALPTGDETQFRTPSLEEATAQLCGLPMDNLMGIKALHQHKEIKEILELV
ncbi:MAG: hypothetical protein N4A65_00495 [Cohaesibacter sp.]|jgi:hypothetical protein|nr:hypothetical protein [Cohaesibacter sp.]